MADRLIQTGTLTDIADAIRAKTGKAATMTPLEMPSEIESIETGGGSFVEVEITLAQDYPFSNPTSTTIMNLAYTAVGTSNFVVALKHRSSENSKNTFAYGVNITDQGMPTGTGFTLRSYARANGTGGYSIGSVGGTGCSAWTGDVFTVWGWD